MKRCDFCKRAMDLEGDHPTHYVCPVCGYEDIYGPYKLPDPDRLREEAATLEALAEQVEASELAAAIEGGEGE